MKKAFTFIIAATMMFLGSSLVANSNTSSTPRIAKWLDNKKAAFYMSFDDGCESHLVNVIPLLQRYKAKGTFYIMYGTGIYPPRKDKWDALIGDPAVTFGNHTLHHCGAKNLTELDAEVVGAQKVIADIYKGRKHPGLVSFAIPGGVPWDVTDAELESVLKKYNLIVRLPFYGPPELKSKDAMIASIDTAVQQGALGHLDFHGVGGDWISIDVPTFTAILEKIASLKDVLWHDSAINCQKYAAQRDASSIVETARDEKSITLTFTCPLDPALYDMPLTIMAAVPETWQTCAVTQDGKVSEVKVSEENIVQFNARPGNITLTEIK